MGLGLRWMVDATKQHSGGSNMVGLTWEIIDRCYKKEFFVQTKRNHDTTQL
ncbi:hypothetical protein [Candidatus Hodgkinia cicadicola]|uniref:hypothetical protein n=1 Tax=Candidatus Hodgkinia cicadicola TaxID=573658 RepID=UPI001788D76D